MESLSSQQQYYFNSYSFGLPNELTSMIFQQLDTESLRISRLVSKIWKLFLDNIQHPIIRKKLSSEIKHFEKGKFACGDVFTLENFDSVRNETGINFKYGIYDASPHYYYVALQRHGYFGERDFVLVFNQEQKLFSFRNNSLFFPSLNAKKDYEIISLKASQQTDCCAVLYKKNGEGSVNLQLFKVQEEQKEHGIEKVIKFSDSKLQSTQNTILFDIFNDTFCHAIKSELEEISYAVGCNGKELFTITKEIHQLKILEDKKQLILLTDKLEFFSLADSSKITPQSSCNWPWTGSMDVSFIFSGSWIIGFSNEDSTLSAYHMESQNQQMLMMYEQETSIVNLQQNKNLAVIQTYKNGVSSLLSWAISEDSIFSVITPQLPTEFFHGFKFNMLISDLDHCLFIDNTKYLATELVPNSQEQQSIEQKDSKLELVRKASTPKLERRNTEHRLARSASQPDILRRRSSVTLLTGIIKDAFIGTLKDTFGKKK